MNEQYLVKRTKYVASPFLQLYDVCFTETTLESLSKTGDCRSGANRSSGFSGQVSNGATCIVFFKSNRNIFFLLVTIKSVHWILLMFAITICGIFLQQERNKSSGIIIWSLSFSRSLAFLSFQSWSYSSARRASDIALLQMMI